MTQDEIEARGEFTPRTQGEIDRNLFAARTGGLVNLSGAAFWEMYYSARAWQRHVEAMRPENQRAIEEMIALDTGGAEAVFAMRKERRDRLTKEEAVLLMTKGAEAVVAHRNLTSAIAASEDMSSPLAPQARDTTPSEEA